MPHALPIDKQRRQAPKVRCLPLVLAYAVVLAISLPGCGGAGHGEVPVSGQVTLDDKPLANAHLTFQPVAKDTDGFGPGSFGRTDGEGRFSLRTVWPDAEGAIPGKHRVQISFEDPASRPAGAVIPREYREGKAVFEVPESGTDQAVIALKSNE